MTTMTAKKPTLTRCQWQWCIAPALVTMTVKNVKTSLCDAHAREARKTCVLKLRRR
jgi:hypothetical protein